MSETRFNNFDFATFQSQLGNVTSLNQFVANITLPPALRALFPESDQFARKIPFAIRSATIPDSTIGEIPVPFRGGKKFRIPGDRDSTATWPVTVRFDIKAIINDTFERWSDAIVGEVDADSAITDENVLDYMGTGELYQLSRNGRIIKEWKLANIWPSVVGGWTYDFGSDNSIVEQAITFVFQHKESRVTRNNVISEEGMLSGELVF